jgi:cytochrome c oxidase subunit 2
MHGTTIISGDSPQAAAVLDVFTIVLTIAAVIFLIVLGVVITNIIRFRRSKRPGEPRQDFGNPKLEIIWTVVPALLLIGVFIVTVRAMHNIEPPPRDHKPDLTVTANQWWWKAQYPGTNVVVADEIHMPVNELWLIRVLSSDVVHDFWIPNLGPKVDAVPNHPNFVWLKPTDTGSFGGMCAEYCGAEHAWMRFTVVVQSREDYNAWLEHQEQYAAEPTDPDAVSGMRLFMSKTCSNCHAVRGTLAKGDIGPDLTHLASRGRIAGGVLSTSHEDLIKFVGNPQSIKPGCNMPDLGLSPEEVRHIVAYLESLK